MNRIGNTSTVHIQYVHKNPVRSLKKQIIDFPDILNIFFLILVFMTSKYISLEQYYDKYFRLGT